MSTATELKTDKKFKPLFAPWQEPNAHRVRAEKAGDRASDVAAFAKNAGSQCLRIDFLANGD